MKKSLFVSLIFLAALGGYFFLRSEIAAPPKVYRIGIVVRGSSYAPGVDGFKSKMAQLGYREGETMVYDVRFVDNREDLPKVLAELIAENADLLHVYSTPATVEAYNLTKTIPIVFGSMGDPLASKTVYSLESSGTNVTGVSSQSSPLAAKRLEFLLEAAPRIRRVAMPFAPEDIPGMSSYQYAMRAAEKLGVTLVPYHISAQRPVKETAQAIFGRDVEGIVISSDSAVWANLSTYVAQAIAERLPFAVFDKDMVVRGGLIGYGPDYFVSGEQSAILADKILKGARPTDLPIEIPQKLILAVNLKTADAIGLKIPEGLLRKADLIISE